MLLRFILLLMAVGTISAEENRESTFTEIYRNGAWGRQENGSGSSGTGSSFQNAYPYMKFIENFIKMNSITSVLDLGCGDWTFSRHIDWGDVEYTGIDIVKSVIEKNNASFGTKKIKFIHSDLVSKNLPSAELVICKDVFQHLSNTTILSILENITDFKHFIITNDVDPKTHSSDNPDISDGDHRFLDLTKPPFNQDGVKLFIYPSEYVIKQVLYIKR